MFMFNFAKKASLKAAAKNILENTGLFVRAIAAYEKAFHEAITAGDSEKAAAIMIAATEDSNVRAAVSRIQFNLNCLIPLEDISNDLLKPYLSAVYPANLTATIGEKALNEILFQHFQRGDNTPMVNHSALWGEVMIEIKKWAGENWSGEGVNDPRFDDLFPKL